MKDFPFWRGAIHNAKTAFFLKSVGVDLAQIPKESAPATFALNWKFRAASPIPGANRAS